MSETSWTLMCALHLPLLCFARSTLTNSFFNDTHQIYEGSSCQLRHGAGEGVCVKTVNCPEVLAQIQTTDYRHIGECDFFNFDDKVCCTKSASRTKYRIRPADTACEKYNRMVPRPRFHAESYFPLPIYNGVFASVNEFPHMAALGYPGSNDERGAIRGMKYLCGGTLISLKHVITAAHCVSNADGLVPVEVLLGTINLNNPNSKRIPISRIIKHPQYARSRYYHDVAILELKKMAEVSSSVRPTCLMTKPSSSLTSTANPGLIILGWGAIDQVGETTTRGLMKAEGLKFVEKNKCSKSYINGPGIPHGLDDGMICVVDADTTRNADTCRGDSGGPLMIVGHSRTGSLAGITSFGHGCGGTTPGVYVSVYEYLDWIEEQVWPASN